MKRLLSNIFFSCLEFYLSILLKYYRLKNRKRKKVLVYTDSRGHEITKLFNKHNPFSSYAKYFIKNYNADVFICPEKHTTFFDFLYFVEQSKENYAFVISHIGVVDFAPRPISQLDAILKLKAHKIKFLFGEEIYESLKAFQGYDVIYNNEKTSSIVPEFLIEYISVKMRAIQNLIWINCNPVLNDWLGNYKKQRPLNTNMVREKSIALQKTLPETDIIDLTGWDEKEIKLYTCDNIHLSKEGMDLIEDKIKGLLQ